MTCERCEEMEQIGFVAYFRWKEANIGVIGCQKHVSEIFEVLRKSQPSNRNLWKPSCCRNCPNKKTMCSELCEKPSEEHYQLEMENTRLKEDIETDKLQLEEAMRVIQELRKKSEAKEDDKGK